MVLKFVIVFFFFFFVFCMLEPGAQHGAFLGARVKCYFVLKTKQKWKSSASALKIVKVGSHASLKISW